MIVIGVIGRNSSGKDALVDYLHRAHGVRKLSVGDVVRDIARQEGVEPTRDNLHEISQRYLREQGEDVFIRRLIARIERGAQRAVGITGVRSPSDVRLLREHFESDFVLVHVEVGDVRTRYERAHARGSQRDPKSLEEFEADDAEEEETFHIEEAIAQADLVIRNDGTLQAFHERIEAHVAQPWIVAHEANE